MKKSLMLIIFFTAILLLALTQATLAAPLDTLEISLTTNTVNPGEEVTINFNFGQPLGAFTFDVDFDTNLFEFVTSSVSASTAGGTTTLLYYDPTGGANPATSMSVTFRALAGLTTSNPTQFMITANGIANSDASVIFDDITVPIVRDVLVEPAYIGYVIEITNESTLQRDIENPINVRISSPMGRYYDHLRLVAHVVTPSGATFRLLGTDSGGLEHDVILSGWGAPSGFGLGGAVDITYNFMGIFSEDGNYTLTLNLIDRDNSDEIISTATRTFAVGVPVVEEPIVTNPEENVLPRTGINQYVYLAAILLTAIIIYAIFNRKNAKKF